MQLNENRVRERAYKIWEAEGRPDGCAEKHWNMACQYEQSTSEDSYSTLGEEVGAQMGQDQHAHGNTRHKKKDKHQHH